MGSCYTKTPVAPYHSIHIQPNFDPFQRRVVKSLTNHKNRIGIQRKVVNLDVQIAFVCFGLFLFFD